MVDHFGERRQELARRVGESAVIIPSYTESFRNADTHHRFRPASDFYYLTGFCEPDSILVVTPEREGSIFTLFVRPRDQELELYHGYRAGVEGAVSDFGIDSAFPLSDFMSKLPDLLTGYRRLYYSLGLRPDLDSQVISTLRTLRAKSRRLSPSPVEIVEPSTVLHEMRLIKSEFELELMRRAAQISAEAHCAAMAFTQAGRYEYEIEALLESHFRRHGSEGPAYPTIVGSGINATVLHYISNRSRLEQGQLLLVDAGAEYDFYAADITRTYPVSGKFSPAQRDLYQLVLEGQEQAIALVRKGQPYDAPHNAAIRTLVEGLRTLGLLSGCVEELIETEAYKRFCPHGTSHWLGLDVHDAGAYVVDQKPRRLEPGMVLTVEPGVYFRPGTVDPSSPYFGFGIRIEDDILVTADDPEIITRGVPKQVDELEARVGSGA